MPVFVSLLRGINVGGRNKIKMAELRDLYASLKLSGVKTLLQTGNAVFRTDETDPAALTTTLETAIQDRFGFTVAVTLRTPDAIETIYQTHPFTTEQLSEPRRLRVMFLKAAPDDAAVTTVLDAHTGPEMLHISGREIYICYADSIRNSKLTGAVLERKLSVVGTARNWNTIEKLQQSVQDFSAE